ncbi:MAG: ABC transporter substrate-binding protein [Bacilli bacterium]|jgi:ABC-type transport system substrate-binding protein|nr:ABC transporter substrate-binding protein [Bacilli bacterium]
MKISKAKFLFLSLLLVFSASGCGTQSTSSAVSTGSQNQSGSVSTGTRAGTVFRLARTWDRTGIRYHYNSGSNIGALAWLSCEGLVQYVRTTDELFYMLAESIDHLPDHTSLIHLRHGVKWHDGHEFTADDVLSYYGIQFTTVTNYLAKEMEKVDEYTVKMTWKTWMEPTDKTKTLMMAQDKVGTVPYSEFKEYVDTARNILKNQASCKDGYFGWAPYGKVNSASDDTKYNDNYKKFMAHKPAVFCGTGPYKLSKLTQTQMILVKNEDYYFADKIPFEKVLAYNIADLSTIYNMLLTGKLDYQDGFAPDTTIDEITSTNPTMIHLKAYDPAGVGILFNLEKTSLWTDKVREAFLYLFDREEMKNSANKYAVTSYYPVMGMVSSEAKKFISESDFKGLPQYSHDAQKAASLLKEAGWSQQSGEWYDQNGNQVSLTLGYDSTNAIMSSLAEATQGGLKNFGINCELKRAADWGTWNQLASAENSYYDFVVNWTDLGLNFSHPKGCYDFFFNDQNGPIIHFPRITQDDVAKGTIPGYEVGNINLHLPKHDGSGYFDAYDYLSRMYAMDETELASATADLLYGVSNLKVGVQFFQNVSGGFYNSGTIGNLPLESYWKTERNVPYMTEMYSDDYYALARCSLEFCQQIPFIYQYTDAGLSQ